MDEALETTLILVCMVALFGVTVAVGLAAALRNRD